ncbi:hypothetical protein AXF42_Ash013825 [Apostasia shenzhenica]|uniref:Uncharacterized protein n=1 Tax=Apostasia shenzhenica TaxID=1088818 RepID=A0A2I0A501_9ASPA|nr:hypothetical protein AXF42_Ash013825 [Apostasia shenzhenica]
MLTRGFCATSQPYTWGLAGSPPFHLFTNFSLCSQVPDQVKPRPRGSTKPRPRRATIILGNVGHEVTERCPTAPFLVQSTFPRPTNQGSACSNRHESPEEVPILKDSTLILRLPAPPSADKRRQPRACPPPFLRKIRIKLCTPSHTNTMEQSPGKGIDPENQSERGQKIKNRRNIQGAGNSPDSSTLTVSEPQLRSSLFLLSFLFQKHCIGLGGYFLSSVNLLR